jgi:hypothetical protein
MKTLAAAFCGLLIAALPSTSALADTVFDFTITGLSDGTHLPISGLGQLITSDLGGGTFLITSVTGTVDGFTITNLYAPGTIVGNDDLLVSDPVTRLSNSGTVFGIADGQVVFLSGFSTGHTFIVTGIPDNTVVSGPLNYEGVVTITPESSDPATVPEPSSIALLGSGALGLAGIVRRKLAT